MKSSRRKFLKAALAAPLAAGLGSDGHFSFAQPVLLSPGAGQEKFENPQIIRYDEDCFTLHGRDTFITGAAFHYARCPRELWGDRLLKLKQAGFNTLETYVFWNYHEPVEGQVQMGELEDFINQAQQAGFYLIVRPGPYACAEWDAGGFPHWIVAKQFPLRSAAPESIETSQHWFNSVLPVIQRHMITNGGPVIMVQVENEYDYWKLADAEKRKYITALAEMAWNAGIDVPIITNWCKQARENSDPVMARIMDTADFYPRWNIVKETLGPLAQLRQQEPGAPLGVTELQGGWFSQFGGKLSVDQPGVGPAQLNMLTKTMIEHGVTYFNYYMGFGGTNFEHAAKRLTTTYDYAAPVREPGGLWEKYYAARGINEFLKRFGPLVARSQPAAGAQSTNAQVSVTERRNGKSGFLFIRENGDANQQYKFTFPNPASPSNRLIAVPREGELELAAREMKMLPVEVPLPGSQLRYTTAEALAVGLNVDRAFLVLYDEPGRAAEIALATAQEPKVEGETTYQYWESENETIVIGVKFDQPEKVLLLNDELEVILLQRDLALRTWIAAYPIRTVPDMEGSGPIETPFITDCMLMSETGSDHQRAWADLHFGPGNHHVAALWPSQPNNCRVDGDHTSLSYEGHLRTAAIQIQTPPVPARPVNLTEVESWVEKIDLSAGNWLTTPARALELLGQIPYGYVKYHAEFTAANPARLTLDAFCDDARQVFINGKSVPGASNKLIQAECDVSAYVKPGSNALEILYESFGSPNFGPRISELKGVKSASIGGQGIDSWKIQLTPAAVHGSAVDPDFSEGGWLPGTLGAISAKPETLPSFCWTRARFSLEQPPEEWSIPWKLAIEADRDALLYFNGKFAGRYVTVGPQKDFYIPEPWIAWGEKNSNAVTIVLAYADQPQHIKALRFAPYEEYAMRRTRVEFSWR
ncbi:MAG: beta-galactosidase [Acidobacteriota bacterium]|nr:beta-galactosidase [Acidobacteriota bacterium]